MTDQKLVDELEKALRDEAYDGGFGYMGDEQFTAYMRTLAETAAEVVEKAHTPTDDEREALARIVQDVFLTNYDAARRCADEMIAMPRWPFRRTEVPEPSECASCLGTCGNGRHCCENCEHAKPQGEPSDAQVLETFLGKLAGDGAYTLDFTSAEALHGHIVSLLKRDIADLRAAGGVR